jgi:hypothetical protein
VSELQKRYGRYILLPSNFASVINVKGDEFVINQAYKYGHIKTEEDRVWLENQLVHQNKNLRRFVSVLPRIREEFSHHSLVIRPHPTDSHAFWKEATKNIENTHVIYEGSPTPWLLGADAIFHHGCSTGVEARIMGRCAIAFHPEWDARFDLHPSTRIGPVAREDESLVEFIRNSIEYPDRCFLRTEEAENYICAVEGEFASERILDVLDAVQLNLGELDLTWGNPRAAIVKLHEIWRKVRRNVNPFADSLSEKRLRTKQRSRQKWPGATRAEVASLVSQFDRITGRFSGLVVADVLPDLFCIYSKEGN